ALPISSGWRTPGSWRLAWLPPEGGRQGGVGWGRAPVRVAASAGSLPPPGQNGHRHPKRGHRSARELFERGTLPGARSAAGAARGGSPLSAGVCRVPVAREVSKKLLSVSGLLFFL